MPDNPDSSGRVSGALPPVKVGVEVKFRSSAKIRCGSEERTTVR